MFSLNEGNRFVICRRAVTNEGYDYIAVQRGGIRKETVLQRLLFYYHQGSQRGENVQSQRKGHNGVACCVLLFEQSSKEPHVGGTSHMRRKFIKAQRSHPRGYALAIKRISDLYVIEKNVKGHNATEQGIAWSERRLISDDYESVR